MTSAGQVAGSGSRGGPVLRKHTVSSGRARLAVPDLQAFAELRVQRGS